MKTLVSTFALALALAFTGPAFAGDATTGEERRRLRESWRHMGCCKERMLREKDVTLLLLPQAHEEGRSLR